MKLKNWGKKRKVDALGINRRNLDHVFADYRPGKFRPLDDKLLAKARLEEHSIPTPETLCVVRSRNEMEALRAQLGKQAELVIKPARGWGGRGILVLERDEEGWRSAGGRRYSVEEIIDHASETLVGAFSLDEAEDAVLVETRIRPHEFQTQLFPNALSDLRVVLNRREPIQAMLRVPTNRSDGKANLHEGGIGLGVDLNTGRVIHAIQGGASIDVHPDSGIELAGLQIPLWEECLAQARRVADAFSEIDYIGVDIVLDETRGPLVLEVNARPGLAIQLANGGAQQVDAMPTAGPFERLTIAMSWAVLAALAIAPFAFGQWRQHLTLQVERIAVRDEPQLLAAADAETKGSVEWAESAISVSAQNQAFADARGAAERGDTEEALNAYLAATADPAVAPFALNNMALIYRDNGQLERAEELLGDAIGRLPDYARGRYNLALVQRDLGRRDDAMATLMAVLQIDPSYGRAWGELGELSLESGKLDLAIEQLERAIRFEPTLVGYRRALGSAHLEAGFPGRAVEALGRALALKPESRLTAERWVDSRLALAAITPSPPSESALDSLVTISRLIQATNPLLAAEVEWISAGPLAANARLAKAPSRDSRRQFLLAHSEFESGDWSSIDSAELRSLREVGLMLDRLDADPGRREDIAEREYEDPRASVLASWLRGRPFKSWALDAARSLDDDPAFKAWLDLLSKEDASPVLPTAVVPSKAYALRLRSNEASAHPLPGSFLLWSVSVGLRLRGADSSEWDRALDESAPWFLPRQRRRFQEFIGAEHWDRAHELGFEMMKRGGDDGAIALQLIEVELRRGRKSIARSLWDDLESGAKTTPAAQLLYAQLLLAEGKPKSATKRMEKLLGLDPLNVDALLLHARALSVRRKWSPAEKSLRRALDLQPERISIREQLARLLMERRVYGRAAAEWERILQLTTEPRLERSALFNLALSRQRNGEFEASIAAWDRLLDDETGDHKAQFNRALALEGQGRMAEAAAGFETVLRLQPDHAGAARKLEALRGSQEP